MPVLPKFREVAQEFAALDAKVAELRAQHEKAAARVAPLMEAAHKRGVFAAGPIFETEKEAAKPTLSRREVAARELLGEHAPPVPPPPRSSAQDPLRQELAELSDELATLQGAIDLIMKPPVGGGRSPWEQALLDGARAYCEVLAPVYASIAKRYVAALVELGESINAHAEFADTLRGQGVPWAGLRPLPMVLPPPHFRTGPLHDVVAWAISCGHAPADVMPHSWLKPSEELKRAAERQYSGDYFTI